MNTSHRKLGTLLFLLIISVCVAIPAFAFQNEPDGFRGIKWGTNINELYDMLVAESGKDTLYYVRKNDTLKVGDAVIDQISYGFYKNRFFVVLVEYNGYLNFTKLKAILIDQYGKPEQPNRLMEKYFWTGGKVDIFFDYNEISKHGNIYYAFRPIQEERASRKQDRKPEYIRSNEEGEVSKGDSVLMLVEFGVLRHQQRGKISRVESDGIGVAFYTSEPEYSESKALVAAHCFF